MVSSSVKQILAIVIVLAAAYFAPSRPETPAKTTNPAPATCEPAPCKPDEGMWTFDNLPLEQLKKVYGFEPTKEWIDHVRMSSIKYGSEGGGGGSSSFMSPNGLMMTNHHVALGTVN